MKSFKDNNLQEILVNKIQLTKGAFTLSKYSVEPQSNHNFCWHGFHLFYIIAADGELYHRPVVKSTKGLEDHGQVGKPWKCKIHASRNHGSTEDPQKICPA